MELMKWLYSHDPVIVAGDQEGVNPPGPWDDYWYNQLYVGTSNSGFVVTPDSAMRTAAVHACVRVLAETVSQLPLKVFENTIQGDVVEAPNHPLWDLLHDQPNSWQTSFEWLESKMKHLALRGNAFDLIKPGPRGFADTIEPLHPDRVRREQLANKVIIYHYTDLDGKVRKLTQNEVMDFRGLSDDGFNGHSPIAWARETIGLTLAAEAYGSRFFKNNARPSGILSHPGAMNQEAQDRFKKSWNESMMGSKQGSTAIIEEGMKYQSITMTSEDAQFLETRQYQVTDIARIFRVPPHMIGDLTKATFSNIEQQSLEFVLYTMLPWLKRLEAVFRRDLDFEQEKIFY